MQNNNFNWGNINTKIDKDKDKDEDDYKPDPRMVRLFKSLEKTKEKIRQEKFQDWINEYNENDIQVVSILRHLCDDVLKTINETGFVISNEKQLRNEIATFVYKESNHA
jgi:hypothetical protein